VTSWGIRSRGNNNAYCQDNEIGWVDWSGIDKNFLEFCQQAIVLRKSHPILRQTRFLHSRQRKYDGESDLFWRRADGKLMQQSDWDNSDLGTLIAELRTAAGSPTYVNRQRALLVVLNRGPAVEVVLPGLREGDIWTRSFDTAHNQSLDGTYIDADSVVVFTNEADATKSKIHP
jgi:glycogen operon protein